jgi:hypothetical protein
MAQKMIPYPTMLLEACYKNMCWTCRICPCHIPYAFRLFWCICQKNITERVKQKNQLVGQSSDEQNSEVNSIATALNQNKHNTIFINGSSSTAQIDSLMIFQTFQCQQAIQLLLINTYYSQIKSCNDCLLLFKIL